MRTSSLTVKGLPAGWRILQMKRSTVTPSDALILCEREPPDQYDLNFVTWRANLEMGGCHLGHYFESLRDAETDFAKRAGDMR